jgi:hypothetical protein
MLAKVVNKKNEYCGRTYSVSYLSYNTAAGYDVKSRDAVLANLNDIEVICEEEWEKSIMDNKEILQIKKPCEASYYMYYALLNALLEHFKCPVKSFLIVQDEGKKMAGIWIKEIKALINGRPVCINISGKKYKNIFDIYINDIDRKEFEKECKREIQKVKNGLKLYTKRLNGLMYTIQLLNSKKDLNLTNRKKQNKKNN